MQEMFVTFVAARVE